MRCELNPEAEFAYGVGYKSYQGSESIYDASENDSEFLMWKKLQYEVAKDCDRDNSSCVGVTDGNIWDNHRRWHHQDFSCYSTCFIFKQVE
ncbi:cucumisin-like [Senna tora]|uniref:Cucumisin-like n=1 Tax=Senna tora TaxID=362788 RepID=A0A835CA58_9FABA|nr:cucumisin-like [Senna tora]